MYAGQSYKGSDNYGRSVELRRLYSDLIRYYKKSSAVAEMGDRARAVGRKVGAAVPLSMGELGPHLT